MTAAYPLPVAAALLGFPADVLMDWHHTGALYCERDANGVLSVPLSELDRQFKRLEAQRQTAEALVVSHSPVGVPGVMARDLDNTVRMLDGTRDELRVAPGRQCTEITSASPGRGHRRNGRRAG
jgi:hypothetical protein